MPIRVCPQCNARYRDAASRCPHDGAELQVRPDPLVGRVLGRRYRILDEIGSGGMGTVYRGRHVLVGRDVAIKLLSRSATRDPMWRERFLREAQTTNLLKHENIVDVTDFGDEGGSVFLVMELLEGESLEERLTRETLTPVEAIDIALPVAAALARAHQLDVVHRDIKPGNIFLSSASLGARVKVLDFGIARAAGDAKLTDTGVLLGTPEYMSPEQSLGQTVGPASDLYALGVVLFEAIAGRLPFLGAGAHLLVQHVHDPPPRLQSLCPEVPDALDAAVMRLLAKSPADRFADAHALIAALSAARRERPSLQGTRSGEQRREGAALEPFRARAETLEANLRASFPEALPAPVASLAEEMRSAYEALVLATREGGGVASRLVATDTRHRTTLSRIGGALDVLSRDASQVRERIEAARLRHRAAELDAQRAAADLSGQMLTPSLGLDPFDQKTTPDVVAQIERGARQAAIRAEECLAELNALLAEADDLAFQIQALRGRMGAVSGELQAEREASEHGANELASRVAEAQDAFVAAADSLTLAVDGGRRGG